MTQDLSFGAFLNEFKASLSGPDGEAIARRINTERLVSLTLETLIAAQPEHTIRVVADHRLAGDEGADFLIQIDDYDVRLELVDTPGGVILPTAKLEQVARLLEDNPSTVALVLVWTTDDLLALHFSLARLHLLQQQPERLKNLLANAKPLAEVLQAIISHQTKQWAFTLEDRPLSNAQPGDIRRLFEDAIGTAIEAERERTYHNLERKQAARNFPVDDEKKVIFLALREALEEVPTKAITERLLRITRRGG